MSLLELTAISSTVFFVLTTFSLFLRQQKIKVELQKREQTQKQRLYQISILKEIQDRIGYSLDIEKVIDVITGSLKNLFPYSTASSLLLKNDKLIFKIHLEQTVSSAFILQVKKSMLASLNALIGSLPLHVDEQVLGVPLDETKTAPVGSFFNIPLVAQLFEVFQEN